MKRLGLLATGALIMAYGCSGPSENQTAGDMNPFFAPYGTPFNVHPFDRIEPEHFEPAFTAAMARQKAEQQAIAANPDAPTFANTIAAIDQSGEMLGEVSAAFFGLTGANTNPDLQAVRQRISPLLAAHEDDLRLDPRMFARVRTVYDARTSLDLNDEQLFLLENLYRQYVRNGALLNDEQQARLKEINQALSSLKVTFSDNLLAETNAYELVITDRRDLAGLPDAAVATAESAAAAAGYESAWLFTTHKPSLLPFLTYAENRELRQRLFTAYTMRGNNGNQHDNTEVLADIIDLRIEKAQLLGYDTYADYVLESRMAQTPQRVYDLLDRLWQAAVPVAKAEVEAMQAIIDREGGGFALAPWDWWFYAEKVRKQQYALDDNELRPYFALADVRDGVFWVANQLYGLTFAPIDGLPKPHAEAEVFQVKEADGSHCAILYMDFHPRPGKRQGAWCTTYRRQNRADGTEVDPVVNLVCNFTRPSGDLPALLSLDEVETLFHEFGHALDNMLSDVTYRTAFRSADFSELPSQIMEHWAFAPEVMGHYARHYRTGVPMPDELIEKIGRSKHFNQGFATVEYLAASLLDMKYHTLTSPLASDVVTFETEYFREIGLIPQIVSRYRSSYFAHIIGGYAAGYYGYIWCGVLDSDAFDAFAEAGLFDRETARRFRAAILARNGSADFWRMYRDFRGREPSIEPLLRDRGLL